MRRVVNIGLSVLFIGGFAAVLVLLHLEQRLIGDTRNYTLIDDGLYMGGSVEAPPRGTKAVLNLCSKKDGYRCEVHVWDPISDSEAPELDWLRKQVEFIETQREKGLQTFVHCRNGVNRSGMVVVAYEMKKNDWTRDEALAYVRSKREIVRPNPAFMRLLLDWEAELKKEK